jgi:hypothetical protein
MVVIFAFVIILLLVVFTVPAISTSIARNVVNSMNRGPSSGSIDQSIVEARLTRIEEAIDAMALQIERLTDHQRTLLGEAPPQIADESPYRTEEPG